MVWWNTLRLRSNRPAVRQQGLESLGATEGSRLLEPLIAGLGDVDARVRCAAVRGIARLKGEQSVAALVTALQDSDFMP